MTAPTTSAILLAIADQLRGKKLEGYSIWIAFLDGEESLTRAVAYARRALGKPTFGEETTG